MQDTPMLPLGLVEAPPSELLPKLHELQDYEFSPVNGLLASRYGWSADQAAAVEMSVKQFLALGLLSPGIHHCPMAGEDEYWHAMIIITPWYFEFCDRIFGAYYHHMPDLDLKADREQEELSREARRRWFQGELLTVGCSRCRVNN